MAPQGDAASKAGVKIGPNECSSCDGFGGAVFTFGLVLGVVFEVGAVIFGMGAGFCVAANAVFNAVEDDLLAFFLEATGVKSRSSAFDAAAWMFDNDALGFDNDALGFGVGFALDTAVSMLASDRTTYDGEERKELVGE